MSDLENRCLTCWGPLPSPFNYCPNGEFGEQCAGIEDLPELTEEERTAMNSLPDDFIKKILESNK